MGPGFFLAAAFAFLFGTTAALAEGRLPLPDGRVVLEITGKIDSTTDGSKAVFDIDSLKRMGATTIQTSTPWTDGKVTFQGLSGAALMKLLGAKGEQIQAIAVDDYSVVIPMEDFEKTGALIAYEMNGEPLPAEQFGPLWVVFPYDSNPALNIEAYHARSIWQLRRLIVE